MGQTLSHGVYLPNEGERNCYAGLASNWQILNTAVGNIAEKAPLVHTHGNITNDGKVGTTANVPLITGTGGAVQAGSFGNQANTFCEGNDSRLSDARTPVAHTHTKSDVTDLLNSNFIPSANNSYDLGSSSYQWNNLYAKKYYYNGIQWGLDKNNTWTGDNTYTKYLNAVINDSEIGVVPTNTNRNGILFKDKDGVNIGWLRHQYDSNGDISIEMLVSNKYKNGALDPTGTQIYQGVKQVITSTGTAYFNWSGYVNNSINPYTTETFNIGDSTHQWNNLYAKKVNTQSVNGVNPGALSLPNFDSDGYVDLSSNLTENVQYSYTPAVDGWLALYAQVNGFYAENAVGIFNGDTTLGNNSFRGANTVTAAINLQRQTGKYFGSVFLPVKAGYPYLCWLRVDQSTTLGQKWLIFYKAKGNV